MSAYALCKKAVLLTKTPTCKVNAKARGKSQAL